jgi:hypothetical protein
MTPKEKRRLAQEYARSIVTAMALVDDDAWISIADHYLAGLNYGLEYAFDQNSREKTFTEKVPQVILRKSSDR